MKLLDFFMRDFGCYVGSVCLLILSKIKLNCHIGIKLKHQYMLYLNDHVPECLSSIILKSID